MVGPYAVRVRVRARVCVCVCKWKMVNGLHLYSAFIQSAVQLMPHSPVHTHIHTPTAIGCHARHQPARQEQLGVRCLAQGHFDTPRVGSNRQPSDCQTTALPPEPHRPDQRLTSSLCPSAAGNPMGVNGGVGAQPPNQQSNLLQDAMLHTSMNSRCVRGFGSAVTTARRGAAQVRLSFAFAAV